MERRSLLGLATATQLLYNCGGGRTKAPETKAAENSKGFSDATATTTAVSVSIQAPVLLFLPELRHAVGRSRIFITKIEHVPATPAGDRSVRVTFSNGRHAIVAGAASALTKAHGRATRQSACAKITVAYTIAAAYKTGRMPLRLAEPLMTQRHLEAIPVAAAADLLMDVMNRHNALSSIEFDWNRRVFSIR